MIERIIWMLGGAIITVVVFVLAQQFLFGTTSAEQISQEEAEQIVLNAYSGEIQEVNEDSSHYSVKVGLPSGSYIVYVDKQSGELDDLKFESKSESNEETTTQNTDNKDEQGVSEQGKNTDNPEEDSDQAEDPKKSDEPVKSYLTKDEILNQVQGNYSGEVLSVEFLDDKDPFYTVELEADNEFINLKIDAENGQVIDEQLELKKQTPITEDDAVNIAMNKQKGNIDDIEYTEINGNLYYLIEIETEDEQDVTVRINALNGDTLVIWEEQKNKKKREGR
ncbi:PepSY domain-containing protein [Piscibacillus salipiscarius]|uniref:PepSY domain-containing protein n=1 Tax=Piscibacillus salipiscarius TaxID=299480 RepID=UPI0006D24F71|nr:PepSY domain-containing protein [Piscibacillus salipiscarius]